MRGAQIDLDKAIDLTRTGDVWLFRGRTAADRAIQVTTNSPVNHVGMSVVLDDMPPLMWHAELGKSLNCMWSGNRHRGVQLHDLREAVLVWGRKYGQQGWLRQLESPVTREMEDAVLTTIARLDGTPFPSTARLASRWVRGRVPVRRRRGDDDDAAGSDLGSAELGSAELGDAEPAEGDGPDARLETAYCAEVVAVTYEAMGLLATGRHLGWYDPGRFWSGDELALLRGASLGGELAVNLPL
jgi:hypothetical protein